MSRLATLAATWLLLILLAAACSGGSRDVGGGDLGSTSSAPETTGGEEGTGPPPETTQEAQTTPSPQIEQVSSGSDGLNQPQVVVAPSAGALAQATGARVPEAGAGTYLAVFWGEKPTGGYTVEVLSARTEGRRVIVQLSLEEPPPDAMVSQALTYPYAAAVMRGVDPGEKEFVFFTQNGRELGWPVRNV